MREAIVIALQVVTHGDNMLNVTLNHILRRNWLMLVPVSRDRGHGGITLSFSRKFAMRLGGVPAPHRVGISRYGLALSRL